MKLKLFMAIAVFSIGLLPVHGGGFSELVGPAEIPRSSSENPYQSENNPDAPRISYNSWSLFLICTPGWATPEKNNDLARLYMGTRNFGWAIGEQNLAVWFWKEKMIVPADNMSQNINISRSAQFCQALGLAPSKGPYLVVTTDYPDVNTIQNSNKAVLRLGGLSIKEIEEQLNALADKLLLSKGKLDPKTYKWSTPTLDIFSRLLEATRKAVVGLSTKIQIQIDAGPIKTTIPASQ